MRMREREHRTCNLTHSSVCPTNAEDVQTTRAECAPEPAGSFGYQWTAVTENAPFAARDEVVPFLVEG
jgi:hypothetical protein